MGSDRNEHEPDEYDPEEEFRDPDSDSLTIPQVSTEDAGSGIRSEIREDIEDDRAGDPTLSTDEIDVPPELLKSFWALVLVINGALLAYSLAALYLIFEGQTTYATYLFAAGTVLSVFAVRRYRTIERRDFETDDGTDSDDERTDENAASTVDDGDESPTETAADDETGAESDDDPRAN